MQALFTATEQPALKRAPAGAWTAALAIAACSAAVCAAAVCSTALAADIRVSVRDQSGKPVEDAVVVAVPAALTPAEAQAAMPSKAYEVIDQVNSEFAPRVKPILAGSFVEFPNRDNIRHQVYSFSPAKVFNLPLYAGTPAKPLLFDKPGVVVLGCNIHDWMVGYVYVAESPWFVKTGADGTAVLRGLPSQRYTVRVWHPQLEGTEAATRQAANFAEAPSLAMSWAVRLRPEVRIRRAPTASSHSHY